jgi:ATP-dependent RNA helicase DeaD
MLTKLHVDPMVMKAAADMGYEQWTDIQLKSIPLIQAGKDVIGQAHTGSGKTAAFGIPIVEKLSHTGKVQSLIIVPTRELCEQITRELYKFAKYKKLNILAVYGGVSIEPQIDKLRGSDIVVGTPGRLLDHMDRRTIDLRNINTLVLDEADRMLDMGFIDDIRKIISALPQNRQTLLFSATLPQEIQNIVRRFMKNPERVKTESYVDKGKLSQYYYNVDTKDKFSLLVHLLKSEESALTIIFCSTRHMADIIEKNLNTQKIPAQALHGGLTQNKRLHVIKLFHEKKINVLVASDVAARGLDIKDITHVINYDIPKTSKDYIHRIGRTARAGTEGVVYSILSHPDYDAFRSVLSDRSLTIEKLDTPQFEPIRMEWSHDRPRFGSQSRGRSHGGRGSGGSRGPRSGSDRDRPSRDSHGASPSGQRPRRHGFNRDSARPRNFAQRRGN